MRVAAVVMAGIFLFNVGGRTRAEGLRERINRKVAELEKGRGERQTARVGKMAEMEEGRSERETARAGKEAGRSGKLRLTLRRAVELALERNASRPASLWALRAAEAQYRQTLAAYRPHFDLTASFTRSDEPANFVFPASDPTGLIMAGIFTPQQAGVITSERDVKLWDRDLGITSLGMTYPLSLGGKRKALRRQAARGVDVAREEMRRTDMRVVYDVHRYYYTAIMARKVARIARTACEQLGVTLTLTKRFYESGSGRVKKTDYLRNKTAVEALRSMTAWFESKVPAAEGALVNAMGLPWDTAIDLEEDEIPYEPREIDLAALTARCYRFNPDLAKLKAALKALEASVDERRSGLRPQVALLGTVNVLSNAYDTGIATEENSHSWSLGVSMRMPLFDGGLTRARVAEARARVERLARHEILLEEGLALQVKHLFHVLVGSKKRNDHAQAAREASIESRDLMERAYMIEMAETKEVIETQMMEAYMKAQAVLARFEHAEAMARLDFVLGTQVAEAMRGDAPEDE